MSQGRGLSLVEILIAMVILGALLGMLGRFFIFNERVGSRQITAAQLNNDVRLAFLRIGDVTAQAQYIYPAGQTLRLNGSGFNASVITGVDALAILVPSKTTYCPATSASYCGFVFSVEDSSPYAAILGSSSAATGWALAEYRFTELSWDEDTLPSKLWQDNGGKRDPLVNSVDRTNSSLAAPGNLEFADYSSFDETAFIPPPSTDEDDLRTFGTEARAIVTSVKSTLELAYTLRGKRIAVQRENFAYARAVPRSGLPE